MKQDDRDSVVRALETHSQHSKSAIQAMHEALTKSETERRKMEKSCLEVDRRLQAALADQQRLEEQNAALVQQVEHLSHELAESRQHASELLRQAQEESKKEWLKQEAMFKNTIRNLKKRIRADSQSVSLETHQEVVQRAEHLQKQLDEFKKNKITNNCRALQPPQPHVRIGRTLFRPVTGRSINVPFGYSPQPTVTGKRSKSVVKTNENVPPANEDMLATRLSQAKGAATSTPERVNDENALRVAPPPPSLPVVENNRAVVNTKSALANRNMNGQIPVRSLKVVVSKRAQKPTGRSQELPVSVRVAKKGGPLRPNFVFKEGKTPSKNRTAIIRENGGLRGMLQKLAEVRSPTFK